MEDCYKPPTSTKNCSIFSVIIKLHACHLLASNQYVSLLEEWVDVIPLFFISFKKTKQIEGKQVRIVTAIAMLVGGVI